MVLLDKLQEGSKGGVLDGGEVRRDAVIDRWQLAIAGTAGVGKVVDGAELL